MTFKRLNGFFLFPVIKHKTAFFNYECKYLTYREEMNGIKH